jgi:hypothetical protein
MFWTQTPYHNSEEARRKGMMQPGLAGSPCAWTDNEGYYWTQDRYDTDL